jgi:hypothetical protein
MKVFKAFGTDDMLSKLNNLSLKNNSGVVKEILDNAGKEINKATKARTPVDTGLLRNNWYFKSNVNKFQVKIANKLDYAPYVDLGTATGAGSFRPGVRMLEKSMKETIEIKLPVIVNRAFSKIG